MALETSALLNIFHLTTSTCVLINSFFWDDLPTLEIIDSSYEPQSTISTSVLVTVLPLIKLQVTPSILPGVLIIRSTYKLNILLLDIKSL